MSEINNNIQESYCSLEVSKLLKEKGFFIKRLCTCGGYPDCICNLEECITLISHALAIEWIRGNFGIWIHSSKDHSVKINDWYYLIAQFTDVFPFCNLYESFLLFDKDKRHYDSPQKATEAALLYTLKNLIP